MHPRFQDLLRKMETWKHTLSMKTFGGPSLKPTWLYSSASREQIAACVSRNQTDSRFRQAHPKLMPWPRQGFHREPRRLRSAHGQGHGACRDGRDLRGQEGEEEGEGRGRPQSFSSIPVPWLHRCVLKSCCLKSQFKSSLSLRFGKALARLRSKHQQEVRQDAHRTIKNNLKGYRAVKRNCRDDSKWVSDASLQPVLDFLA